MNFKVHKFVIASFVATQFLACISPTTTSDTIPQIEFGYYAIRSKYIYNNSDLTGAQFMQHAKYIYGFLFDKNGNVAHQIKYFDSTDGAWIPTVDLYWNGNYETNDRYLSIKYHYQKDYNDIQEVVKSTTYRYQYANDTLVLNQQRVWHGNSKTVIGKWYFNTFDNYEPGREGGDTIDFRNYMNFKEDGFVEIGKTINQVDSVVSTHDYILKNDTLDIPGLWQFNKSTFVLMNGKLIVSFFRENTIRYTKE